MLVLKAVIVTESEFLEPWQYRAVERLLEDGCVRLQAVLLVKNGAKLGRSGRLVGLSHYAGLAGKWRRKRRLSKLADGASVLRLEDLAEGGGRSWRTALQELDFVLMLDPCASDPPAGLPPARFGIWSFRFSNTGDQRLPPGALEVYYGCETTTVVLERRAGDNCKVLRSARQRTRHGCFKNSQELLMRASQLPRLAVLDLINSKVVPRNEAIPAPLAAPATFPWSRVLARSAWRYLRRAIEFVWFDEHWSILIFHNRGVIDKNFFQRENAIAELRFPSWVGYGADPFIVEADNKLYLLFEYYCAREKVGRIDVAVLDADMSLLDYVQDLVPSRTHQSYPFLMQTPRGWLLVPEARASGALSYYLLDSPAGPVRESGQLLDSFAGVDNTICFHAGRYWMFNSHAVGNDQETELLLWTAEDPQGPWVAHPANPVQIDIMGSRPAGPVFTDERGNVFRPAQDGSTGYGGGLVLKRVLALDEHRFDERTALRVTAHDVAPKTIGVHHICATNRYVVIDSRMRRLKSRLLACLAGRARGEHTQPLVRVRDDHSKAALDQFEPISAPARLSDSATKLSISSKAAITPAAETS